MIENKTGDVSDGDVGDGDVSDGGVSDGDVSDGDVSDGDVSDGDVGDGDVSDGDVSDGDVSDGDVSDGGVSDGDTCTRNHIAHSLNNSFSWIRDASWIVHRFLHYVSEELVIVITIKRWLHSEGEQRDSMVTDHWRCVL